MEPDWAELVDRLPLSGTLKLLARSCAYLGREGGTVLLGLDRRSESFLTRERQKALAVRLTDYFGENLAVDIRLQDEQPGADIETPLQREARQQDQRLDAARESLEQDPNVQALKNMFNAEMKPDSVEVVEPQSKQE